MAPSKPEVIQQKQRDAASKLDVIVVGAGLGGLGAAISILLEGHNVQILEVAAEIGEIGAGIQCLPNSTRVLISWGLEDALSKLATTPRLCNMIGWKGQKISEMDFHEYEAQCGTPFWDFHRANLHMALLERAIELGAKLTTNSRVVDIEYESSGDSTRAIAVCSDGKRHMADLVVGADGINSKCREILLGHEDPPLLTGDLAYRLLLDTEQMVKDPELRSFVEDPQVNYWIGPDAHAGTVNCLLHPHYETDKIQSTTFCVAANCSTWSFLSPTTCPQVPTLSPATSKRCARSTQTGTHASPNSLPYVKTSSSGVS
ncbi:Salicylate 1-monooxygenase [Ascochyta rabiei]|uniref:Salicylate 1-monooxygenase n=1 Tax=Didymella rabiei TaxID=5454 RepID=UPI00220BD174|nr:Salicylate 1-monooxygenase [Ascochyta rabiei]UPX11280.1 Salicylate 1-monooxygenase [Ascochyta rabiei]